MMMAELFKELFNIVSFQEALTLGKHMELMMSAAKSSADGQTTFNTNTLSCVDGQKKVNQPVFHT